MVDSTPPSKAPKSQPKIMVPPPPKVAKLRGLGLKPDKPEHMAQVKSLSLVDNVLQPISHRAILGAAVRVAADSSLEGLIEKIWDQANTESCVGWAFAQNIFLRLKKLGTRIELPAPFGIYTPARALERAAAGHVPDGNPLQDVGSSPWLAAQAIAEWGVPSITNWPFDETTVNDEPDFMKLEIASAFELQGYAPMLSDGQQLLADIAQALGEGFPVVIGATLDKAFMDYDGKSVLGSPDPKNIVGQHMMNIVAKRSDGTFRVLNQWGPTWGNNGMATVNGDFLTNPQFVGAFMLPANASGHMGVFRPAEEEKKS